MKNDFSKIDVEHVIIGSLLDSFLIFFLSCLLLYFDDSILYLSSFSSQSSYLVDTKRLLTNFCAPLYIIFLEAVNDFFWGIYGVLSQNYY